MDIAALIISVISLLISIAVSIVYLSKNVFSQHVVQMVPVESKIKGPESVDVPDSFEEFDMPTEMDLIFNEMKKK